MTNTFRMFVLHESSSSIVQDIRESLDEKRNFYNYVLAVVTVFLGPMTILTGYWYSFHECDGDEYKWLVADFVTVMLLQGDEL